jgi:hypothetical protein
MEATPSVLCALGDERARAFICDQLAADGYPVELAASRSECPMTTARRPRLRSKAMRRRSRASPTAATGSAGLA